MTSWREIPMRDINWTSLGPTMGPSVYALRALCEKPEGSGRQYERGAWHDLTLGQVADLGRGEIMRHRNIGSGAVVVLEQVIALANAGMPLTHTDKVS